MMDHATAYYLEQEYHQLGAEVSTLEANLGIDQRSLVPNAEALSAAYANLAAGRFVAVTKQDIARLTAERQEIEDDIRGATADIERMKARRAEIVSLLPA